MGIWQLGKMVEHPNQHQPDPGALADGTPCRQLRPRHNSYLRDATIPGKVTPTPTLTPAKTGSELTPATPTPLKTCNLPYIVEPNPESDSDSFWEKSGLQATQTPGIVATLSYLQPEVS